jgi:RNA polymerase sigma-70 factor (ECF subfamily)
VTPLTDREKLARFEAAVLPHLDAAYNLARWLTRHEQDAEDVLQEASLRAFKYFDGLPGERKAWWLAVVRNTCYDWLRRRRREAAASFDETLHTPVAPAEEAAADARHDLRHALGRLPAPLRETLVLRELEGLSYKEIAEVAGVPVGTVMSRLARARRRLQQAVDGPGGESDRGL